MCDDVFVDTVECGRVVVGDECESVGVDERGVGVCGDGSTTDKGQTENDEISTAYCGIDDRNGKYSTRAVTRSHPHRLTMTVMITLVCLRVCVCVSDVVVIRYSVVVDVIVNIGIGFYFHELVVLLWSSHYITVFRIVICTTRYESRPTIINAGPGAWASVNARWPASTSAMRYDTATDSKI